MDKCEHCPASFSETTQTLLEGVKTPVSVLGPVVKARPEGRGFHAAARPFEQAQQTILAWERKGVDRPPVLWLSAVVHECFACVREGDAA